MSIEWIIRGGPVMYPLLACSLVSVTITVERLIYWWRMRRSGDDEAIESICELIGEGRLEDAGASAGRCADPVARIIRCGLSHHHLSLEAALRMAAGDEIRSMGKYLRALDTIVTLAPLLGILGTVLGIIKSFDVIGGGRVANPLEVTGGIAEALLTTAVGLVVAMIALVPFNYFTARMDEAVGRMESHLTNVEIMVRKGTGGGPGPVKLDVAARRRRARIEMIPLIDCVFIVLVFFIYAMLEMTVQRGLVVQLPSARAIETNREESVVLTITEDGTIHLNERPVTLDRLADEVERALAGIDDPVVVINADAASRHGRFVEVMDLLKRRGVDQVLILSDDGRSTVPKPSGSP